MCVSEVRPISDSLNGLSLVRIFIVVGLALFCIGCGLVGLAEFLRLLLFQDTVASDFTTDLNTLDDSKDENCDSEDKAGIPNVDLLGEASGFDIQSDVSNIRPGGGSKEGCLVVRPESEETNHW